MTNVTSPSPATSRTSDDSADRVDGTPSWSMDEVVVDACTAAVLAVVVGDDPAPSPEVVSARRRGVRVVLASGVDHPIRSLTHAVVKAAKVAVDHVEAAIGVTVVKGFDGMSDDDVAEMKVALDAARAEGRVVIHTDGERGLIARGPVRVAPSPVVDQPPPTPRDDERPVWPMVVRDVEESDVVGWPAGIRELVVADMRDRDRLGRARYGVPLTARNGRDQLVDLYQELLDAAAYARAAIAEGIGTDGVYRLIIDNVISVRALIRDRRAA